MTNYKGYTNYATWKLKVEFFDGQPCEWIETSMSKNDVAEQLKALIDDYLEEEGKSFALDLARAFLSDVDWHNIAKHLLDDYQAEQAA